MSSSGLLPNSNVDDPPGPMRILTSPRFRGPITWNDRTMDANARRGKGRQTVKGERERNTSATAVINGYKSRLGSLNKQPRERRPTTRLLTRHELTFFPRLAFENINGGRGHSVRALSRSSTCPRFTRPITTFPPPTRAFEASTIID